MTCPKCNAEITTARCELDDTLSGEYFKSGDFEITGSSRTTERYYCPACNELLADNEDDAYDIINGFDHND